MMSTDLTAASTFLCYVLRHRPAATHVHRAPDVDTARTVGGPQSGSTSVRTGPGSATTVSPSGTLGSTWAR